MLHRTFIDDEVEQDGFFVDKYKASKNAQGAGWIASSLKGGLPLSSSSTHNPVGELTATTGTDTNAAFVTAFKARDGVDGAVNSSSAFHCMSIFQQAALAMLSLAHGQAATGTTSLCLVRCRRTYQLPQGVQQQRLARHE